MTSIWEKEINIQVKPVKELKEHYPVIIIGAGMSGLLLAYKLTRMGIENLVIEADKVASGQTKNTTAKISAQHNLIYADIIKNFGMEKALLYAKSQLEAVEDIYQIAHTLHIDCDFKRVDAYLYATQSNDQLVDEYLAYEKLGIKGQLVKHCDLPVPITSALRMDNQAMFNPLKFIQGILPYINVLENTLVVDVEKHIVKTAKQEFSGDHIVFATHFPFVNVPGFYFMRMHQERSYALALRKAQPVNGIYLGIDDGLSFRDYHDLVLIGGENHRCGLNKSGGKFQVLESYALKYFENCEIVAQWSAQDCMTTDKIAYIGRYSGFIDNWLVSTGFNKWGMTNAMVSANLLADIIQGKSNPYEKLYSPNRFKLKASFANLMMDGFYAIKGLKDEYLKVPNTLIEKLPNKHGGIVEYEGLKVGVYKNELGECFIVNPQCPHMGCELSWNPDELSWDCPCHGSRFTYQGQLISNPSIRSLNHE